MNIPCEIKYVYYNQRNSVLLFVFLFIGFFLSSVGYTQTDCDFALDEAQNFYEKGVFKDIPDLLIPCMEDGFSGDEKLRAYKLLIMTYVFDDKQDEANELMLGFLDDYPEYQISPADPVEFKHLFEDYVTVPVYSFGFTLGGNLTNGMITEPYGVSNLNQYDGTYTSGMGFQAGVRINRYLQDNLEINAELIFSQNTLHFSSSEYDFMRVSKKETFTSLVFPVTATYDFPFRLVTPYARSGLSFDYLFRSSGLFKRTYSENIGLTDVTGPEIELTPNRKNFYMSFLLGGGVKYNISNGYLFFDGRFNLGLYNFIDTDNRYADESSETIYKYFYVDDDMLINRLFFSVGYIRRLYQTKRKE